MLLPQKERAAWESATAEKERTKGKEVGKEMSKTGWSSKYKTVASRQLGKLPQMV
jgi:hypothetical protein